MVQSEVVELKAENSSLKEAIEVEAAKVAKYKRKRLRNKVRSRN